MDRRDDVSRCLMGNGSFERAGYDPAKSTCVDMQAIDLLRGWENRRRLTMEPHLVILSD